MERGIRKKDYTEPTGLLENSRYVKLTAAASKTVIPVQC